MSKEELLNNVRSWITIDNEFERCKKNKNSEEKKN